MNKERKAGIIMLLCSLIWGVAFSYSAIQAETLGTYAIIGTKGIASGVVLFLFVWIKKLKTDRESIKAGLICGTACFIGDIFQQRGLELSGAGKIGFLTSLNILIVPIILFIFDKKKFPWKEWLGIGIAIVGLYFLSITESFTMEVGDILGICGALCFSVQIVLIGKFAQKANPIVFSASQMSTIGLWGMFCTFIFERDTFALSGITENLWPFIYNFLISAVIAQTLQVKYQKDIAADKVSIIFSMESIFGALGSLVILGRGLAGREILGGALIVAAVIIAQL